MMFGTNLKILKRPRENRGLFTIITIYCKKVKKLNMQINNNISNILLGILTT